MTTVAFAARTALWRLVRGWCWHCFTDPVMLCCCATLGCCFLSSFPSPASLFPFPYHRHSFFIVHTFILSSGSEHSLSYRPASPSFSFFCFGSLALLNATVHCLSFAPGSALYRRLWQRPKLLDFLVLRLLPPELTREAHGPRSFKPELKLCLYPRIPIHCVQYSLSLRWILK
ncbi:hypothetical protein BDW74DRAFT_80647 [Aspergillus multicolor]|uniref:uncharacterized protein n=1 Tax=Aspergillus multicolor TaxID=41759 RepID=UPI003CCCE961